MVVQPRPGGRAIYATLKEQILAGAYGSQGLLPSSRALALELGVSRTTVTAAYEQLAAEGFVAIRQGARPQVAGLAPSPAAPATAAPPPGPRLSAYAARLPGGPVRWQPSPARLIADFRYGDLAASDFPTLLWKRAVDAAIARRPDRLSYGDPQGAPDLRAALQAYLWRARGLRCENSQIVVVNGSQQGLDLCARLLLDPGDRVVLENPGYAMARHIFSSVGAEAIPVPVDAEGLRTEELEKVSARLAYVTPSHQFPLGGVLPVARRRALLDWARRQGAFVIEDDYDSEFRYDIAPIPPLHALAEEGDAAAPVIYLGTVSKTLSPTLRLGYLVLPPALTESFVVAKQLTDRHTAALEQAALASLLESGAYERHIRRLRRRNAERRALLIEALRRHFGNAIRIEGDAAGLHLLAWLDSLPAGAAEPLRAAALKRQIGIHPVAPLYAPGAPRPATLGLMMGYGALEPKRIERAVLALKAAVDELG
ncbi:PLP-dependent aminotransferase family protein [Roseomonas sp. 18066]|uniref:MocR-like pyridoxine biosynthesis transcription factor PdxR n=1 Tax=Roseomonas sp. 18066 TaxID=2681412 RepID=UPI0013579526|nr:PLP-dependent aminotransferase family protein [Roseomonas sp. 18066]